MEKRLRIAKTYTPKVSIISISYNQEKYIGEAIEGFLMQKTDFEFEVIIADDCSTDKTPQIIKEYAHKYPDIIKPIFRKKNLGAWQNFTDALKKTKGKYIALCEGDDFWTDPNKLQLQVDFLEKHPDYALCFHPVKVFFQNGEEAESIFPTIVDKAKFTLGELLKNNFIQTNSVMYRRQSYKSIPNNILPGDWYLHLYHAQFGKIGFINKVMSAYRRHSGGIWWGFQDNPKSFWGKNGLQHLLFYKKILNMFSKNKCYRGIILKNAGENTSSIIESDDFKDRHLIMSITTDFPEFIKQAMLNKNEEIKDKETIIYSQNIEIESGQKKIVKLEEEKMKLLHSWNYRVGGAVLSPFKKAKHIYRKLINNINGFVWWK